MPLSAYAERHSAVLPAVVWESTTAGGESIILPDGCMDVIWDGERLLVAGPDTAPHPFESTGPRRMTAIRFHPGVAPGVLRTDADELRNTRLPLADLWPRHRVEHWRDALRASADPVVTLELLAATAYDADRAPTWVAPAVRMLEAGSPVGVVAREIGLSPRQLQRQATRRFGYGPKVLQRILRVRSAADAVGVGRRLSDVAADHGYADYAHFHREAIALLGRSPAGFRPAQEVGSGA